MKKTETKEILPNDVKTLDLSKIKTIHLRDGKVLIINNSESSENQSEFLSQARPLFTTISTSQRNECNQDGHDSQKCSRCHKIITTAKTQNAEADQANTGESYQNVQNENIEQNQENQRILKAGGPNVNGQLLNDIITYKEQEMQEVQEGGDYYGEEGQAQEGDYYGVDNQAQGQDQYYGEQEQVGNEETYGYEQQQEMQNAEG